MGAGRTVEVSLWDDWANPETHAALWQWLGSVSAGSNSSAVASAARTDGDENAVGGASRPACARCGLSFIGVVPVPGSPTGYRLVVGGGADFYKATLGRGKSGGIGFAKNRAVSQSCGRLLIFQDSDDVMLPGRVAAQMARFHELEPPVGPAAIAAAAAATTVGDDTLAPQEALARAEATVGAVIGCRMRRIPEDSTPRYSAWVNRVDGSALMFQRFKETT